MLLLRLNPNGFGRSVYFDYSGDLASMKAVTDPSDEPVRGWLIEPWTSLMRKGTFVLYGEDDKVFLHSPEFHVCCSDGSASIRFRKWLVVLYVDVARAGMPDVNYRIHVPIHRYLFNDGMFPEDVEPLYEKLLELDNPAEHARIARLLTRGIRARVGD